MRKGAFPVSGLFLPGSVDSSWLIVMNEKKTEKMMRMSLFLATAVIMLGAECMDPTAVSNASTIQRMVVGFSEKAAVCSENQSAVLIVVDEAVSVTWAADAV